MNGRKTGGRRPGSKNKTTIALEHGLARAGGVAIPYLRSVVLDKAADPQLRLRAAAALAPYEQARLLAVTQELTGRVNVDVRGARERLFARLDAMAARRARRSANGDAQPN
jgi:hypothetical protein